MTDRHTADTINDDALDQLYDRADRAEAELARLHEGEEPGANPAIECTPGQWIHQFNQATAAKRLEVVGQLLDTAWRAWACTMNLHEERVHDGRHAEMALNEVRQVVADMAAQGALQWAGWLRDAMKRGPKHCLLCATDPKPEPASSGPAATQATEPHTGLVVQPYRNDRGENVWVFRCWGTDTCDGWLSLDHYSEQSATRARDRHAAEEHAS